MSVMQLGIARGRIGAIISIAAGVLIYNSTAIANSELSNYDKVEVLDRGVIGSAWEFTDTSNGDVPIIGKITAIERDGSGCVYLFDIQQKHVLQLDSAGRYQRVIGEPGEGPGQLSNPVAFCLQSGTLNIAESVPGRVVRFDLNDGFYRTTSKVHAADGSGDDFVTLQTISDLGKGFVAVGSRVDMAADMRVIAFLGILNEAGILTTSILERSTELASIQTGAGILDLQSVYRAMWCSGTVIAIVPDPSEYRIEVFGQDGASISHVERPHKKFSYTDAERKQMLDDLHITGGTLSGVNVDPVDLLPKYRPVVNAIAERDGELWVMLVEEKYSSAESATGACLFDVYRISDPTKIVLDRQVRAELRSYVRGKDAVFLLRGGVMVVAPCDDGTVVRFYQL